MKPKPFVITAVAAAMFAATIQAADPTSEVFPNFALTESLDASTPSSSGLYVTAVTIGFTVAGVPCHGGNAGCGPTGSIAIPYALTAIKNGKSVDAVIQLEDTAFTGTPSIAILVTQAKTTVYSKSITLSTALSPGYVAYASFPFALPTTKGMATIDVDVLDGGKSVGKGTATFVIY